MSKTPMEIQYNSIKEHHHDKILLFRLGDFYEIFNEDALIASNILNIAMTKRHNRPMCGFPFHALDQYAYKLVNAGHKVAICDQIEDASQTKGLVKRDVISILTKGTWAENPLLDCSINSFLSVITYSKNCLSIIFADLMTGEIFLRTIHDESPISFLMDELTRYLPVETLCDQDLLNVFPIEEELKIYQNTLRIVNHEYFKENELYYSYKTRYEDFFKECNESSDLAIQGLCIYLAENHFSEDLLKHLQHPKEFKDSDTLYMNESTLQHLELVINMKDFSNKGTLFSVMNRTKTLPAARKLRRLLVSPSANLTHILAQQERTEYFYNLISSPQELLELLKGMSDLERLIARLITAKILPRECLALADTVQRAEKLKHALLSAQPFQYYLTSLSSLDMLISEILQHINPECSNMIDGEVIACGVNPQLDELKEILNNSKNFLMELQAEERLKTGISTLKIAYNKIYGYYIEVSKGATKNIPEHYHRKQSLVNSERYTIPELENFEQKIIHAEESIIKLEREIYEQLIINLQKYHLQLNPLAEFVTEVDLRLSLALLAKEKRYTKPKLHDNFEWKIQAGRHPVMESFLKREQFVSNDTQLTRKERILIVTGPNMAGKSTYLRQNALFAIMAQIGSYLPAKSATIGIVDKIFTRIGASDDLVSGRSTFFVEMQEAAMIISQTTHKSLIIMDELGRGTSTQDGLALAWAILEYFLFYPNKKAKILFSTHYHELTHLAKFKGIINLCMAIQENEGKPIFLRKVIRGQTSKSYGIHVAEMAGIENSIVKRANEILKALEKGTFFNNTNKTQTELTLFNQEDELIHLKNQLYKNISQIDPNKLTPLEALRIIFELKSYFEEG